MHITMIKEHTLRLVSLEIRKLLHIQATQETLPHLPHFLYNKECVKKIDARETQRKERSVKF